MAASPVEIALDRTRAYPSIAKGVQAHAATAKTKGVQA